MKIKTDVIFRSLEKVSFSGKIPKMELTCGYEILSELAFDGFVFIEADNVKIQANVKGIIMATCDRCLDQFPLETDEHFCEKVTKDEFISEWNDAFSPDEFIRQYLIIAKPSKLLCSENCKGLCPSCAKNRNKTECICDKSSQHTRN